MFRWLLDRLRGKGKDRFDKAPDKAQNRPVVIKGQKAVPTAKDKARRQGQAVSRQKGKRRHKSKNTITPSDLSYSSDEKIRYKRRQAAQRAKA